MKSYEKHTLNEQTTKKKKKHAFVATSIIGSSKLYEESTYSRL